MDRRHGTFRSIWTDANGLTMHARVSAGPESAPAVVLVHGLGLSGRYMMPVAERLAAEFHVYVPDLPGFGDSDKPARTLDFAELADALAAWIAAAGLGRVALLGNSQGCQVIADLAVRHPDRVARAVLQGPTSPPDERTWFWQFVRWRQNQPYNPPSLNGPTYSAYRKAGLRRILQTFQYSLEDAIEDNLPRIAAPLLIVRGARDPICRQDWAEELTRRAPRGRLVVIPGEAHTLVWTAPLALSRVTRPFLAASPL